MEYSVVVIPSMCCQKQNSFQEEEKQKKQMLTYRLWNEEWGVVCVSSFFPSYLTQRCYNMFVEYDDDITLQQMYP